MGKRNVTGTRRKVTDNHIHFRKENTTDNYAYSQKGNVTCDTAHYWRGNVTGNSAPDTYMLEGESPPKWKLRKTAILPKWNRTFGEATSRNFRKGNLVADLPP